MLLGCGVTSSAEAYGEAARVMPQVRRFLGEYAGWDAGGTGRGTAAGADNPPSVLPGVFSPVGDALLSMRAVHSTEGWCHVPELGLKGSVDATVLARMAPAANGSAAEDVLLPIELKTGHSQSPSHGHLVSVARREIGIPGSPVFLHPCFAPRSAALCV